MSKLLKCADVNPGCDFKIRGENDRDVLRKAADHARELHHMEIVPPDVLAKLKGAIHDEDDSRAQTAGSSS